MPTLKLKDAEIYYEVHGEGQPIVFLSETACDGEVWKTYQVPEFSKDHRVIIHDRRLVLRTRGVAGTVNRSPRRA